MSVEYEIFPQGWHRFAAGGTPHDGSLVRVPTPPPQGVRFDPDNSTVREPTPEEALSDQLEAARADKLLAFYAAVDAALRADFIANSAQAAALQSAIFDATTVAEVEAITINLVPQSAPLLTRTITFTGLVTAGWGFDVRPDTLNYTVSGDALSLGTDVFEFAAVTFVLNGAEVAHDQDWDPVGSSGFHYRDPHHVGNNMKLHATDVLVITSPHAP